MTLDLVAELSQIGVVLGELAIGLIASGIILADVAGPIGPGLPEDFRAVLAVAPELRTEAQKNVLHAYFRVMDAELRAKTDALNASKAPLPVDTKLQELRNQLEFARKPVQPDPALLALRRDVEMSVEQAAARRLTATQDIAWALINSPAFLFNH